MISIEAAILNNIHLITRATIKKDNTLKILISTTKAKAGIKKAIGVERFKVYKDEIHSKLFKYRKRIYNELYYRFKTAKIKIEEQICLQTEINKTKAEAKLAVKELLSRKEWQVIGVLTYAELRTELDATLDYYYLKKFLVSEKLVNDIFCNTEYKSAFHLHVLFKPALGISNRELINAVANYWNLYHGKTWLEEVEEERDYKKYWTKDMFSNSYHLKGNFWDVDFNLVKVTHSRVLNSLTRLPENIKLTIPKREIQQVIHRPVDVITSEKHIAQVGKNKLSKATLPFYFGIILFIVLMLTV